MGQKSANQVSGGTDFSAEMGSELSIGELNFTATLKTFQLNQPLTSPRQ
jgi:hypothetical protein